MEKSFIFEYLDENDFRKRERSVRKYNMLAYKKLTFEYYPELRKGHFLGEKVSEDTKAGTMNYELKLPTDGEDKDIDAIFSVIPDEIFEKYEEEYGIDIKQLTGLLSSSLEEQMFAEFEGMTLSYEIENVEDCSSVQVEEIIDANKSYYDIDLDITAAKNLDVTLTATSNDDTETNSVTLTVIEIDGSWYIDPTAMNIF